MSINAWPWALELDIVELRAKAKLEVLKIEKFTLFSDMIFASLDNIISTSLFSSLNLVKPENFGITNLDAKQLKNFF